MAGYIIAPHADDELIGCYDLIEGGYILDVLYVAECEKNRKEEAEKFCSAFGIVPHFLNGQIFALTDAISGLENKDLYIPSPNDNHGLHKLIYYLIWYLEPFVPTIVYSVYMNDFFVRPIRNPQTKKNALDKFYPSQKALWKHDARYYLFEGYVELR